MTKLLTLRRIHNTLVSSMYSVCVSLPSPHPPNRAKHIPERMDRVVDFPAPLCPRRTVICPSYKFKDKSFKAILVVFCTRNSCGGKKKTQNAHFIYQYHFGRTSTHMNYLWKKEHHIINLTRKIFKM